MTDTRFRVRTPADHPMRDRVRSWLHAHPDPTGSQLHDAGFMVPAWDEPWGVSATPSEVYVIDEELAAAGVTRPPYPLAREFVGPLIRDHGTPEQGERLLNPMLAGEEVWCELFSETEAGSDLASLRLRATRTTSGYVLNGSKTWASHSHHAVFGLLLARTSADGRKHDGISCFVCPMDLDGITLDPIHDLTGARAWNDVHFEDVVLADVHLVGEEGQGWSMAMEVLANERRMMSSRDGLLWGDGPTFGDLWEFVQQQPLAGTVTDPDRARLADGLVQAMALHVLRHDAADTTGAAPEVRRAVADAHGQDMMELWRDLFGTRGIESDPDDGRPEQDFGAHYLFARTLTVGGGTSEIQRNVIAERVLGLPRGR